METGTITSVIQRQDWLDPLADKVQETVTAAFEAGGDAGQGVKNALHGTWLGHPLHPVLTDIPIGSWTAAVVMDAIDEIRGDDGLARASDAAVAIGLVGAVASAITGLTDWTATDGSARKVGIAHGLLNTAGALLFATSLVLRRRDDRGAARGFSTLGFATAIAAAYLGGTLVYGEQIGVNHALTGGAPQDFVPVLPESELGENEPKRVEAGGVRILLVKQQGRINAIAETCSHLGGPLAEGKIEGDTVVCPWHGSRFCLKDGSVVDGPATHPQPCFEVRVSGGQIQVRARS